MKRFLHRMARAARLDVNLYEEVEADRGAMGQATGVVALYGLAHGIGTTGRVGGAGIVSGTIAALICWYLWAYLTYFIGTRLLPEPQTRADPGELLRTIGFSTSPGLLQILGVIAPLENLMISVTSIWMLVAMVIAVRQALDYTSTLRAIAVCGIGWVVQLLILSVLRMVLGI